MSAEHLKAGAGQDFDLDEDLFEFGDVTDAAWDEEEEADLDEIFANFEAEEQQRLEAEAARADDLFDEEDPDELPPPEDFAGLNPDPPPAIPRPVETRDAAPPLSSPTPEERSAAARASEQAAPPVQQAPPVQYAPQPAPQPAPHTQGFSPTPTPQAIYVQAPPAPQPTATPTGLFGMSRGVRIAAWILIAATSMNALVALVALKSTGDLRRSVQDVGDQVSLTASELMRESRRAVQDGGPASRATATSTEPLSGPNPENHPTFELAREEIQHGEYARARQRLYALLAIVDRLDPLVREQVEARANYLLAQATHLQTVERWERSR